MGRGWGARGWGPERVAGQGVSRGESVTAQCHRVLQGASILGALETHTHRPPNLRNSLLQPSLQTHPEPFPLLAAGSDRGFGYLVERCMSLLGSPL